MLTNASKVDNRKLDLGGEGDTCRKRSDLSAMSSLTAAIKNDNDISPGQPLHHPHQQQQQPSFVHQRQHSRHHLSGSSGGSDSGDSSEPPPPTHQLANQLSPRPPCSPVIIMSGEFSGSTGSCNVLVETASGYQLQQPLPRLLVPEATPRSSTSSQSCLSVPGAGSGSSHHGGCGGAVICPDGSR